MPKTTHLVWKRKNLVYIEVWDVIVDRRKAENDLTTFCGWKGMANYYSVVIDGKTNKNCAWYYAEPNDAAKKIKGRIAFWNGVKVQE